MSSHPVNPLKLSAPPPADVFCLLAWALPPVFRWMTARSGLAEAEALKTFNCGIGLVLAVAPEAAEAVAATLARAGEAVLRIGELAERDGAAVRYRGTLA